MYGKILSVVFLLAVCFGTSLFAAEERLEKFLPEKTIAVLSLDNAAKMIADARKNIDDCEKDEATRDITASVKRTMAPYIGLAENQMGVKLNDILDNFSGQLVVGIADEGAEDPTFLLMARMKNPAMFQTLIEQMVKMSGSPLVENKLANGVIRGAQDKAYWTCAKDLFILSNSDKSLQDLLARLANPPANNFLASKRYMQVCPKNNAAGMVMFLDMPNLVACVDRNKKIDMVSHAILKGLGVFEMDGVALNIPDGEGPARLSVLAPDSKTSILHLVKNFKNPGFKTMDWLPAEPSSSPAYLACYADVAAVWKYVMETMQKENPDSFQKMQAQQANLEQMLGFKFEEDLINNLTGEFAVYSPSGFFPNGIYIGVKDADKMKKVMVAFERGIIQLVEKTHQNDRMFRNLQPHFAELSYKNNVIRRLEDGGMIGFLPVTYTYYHGCLVFSKTALLKDLVNDEKVSPLKQHPEFTKALARVPKNCLALTYSDSRPILQIYNEYASYMFAFFNIPLAELKRKAPVDINMEDLPSLKYLCRNTKPSVAYAHTDAQGVHFSAEMSGPLPALYGVSGVAIVAAIAVPSLLENQKAANENAAQAMLKSIVTAQATYNVMNKKYAPNIAALVEAGILNKDELSSMTKNGASSAILNGYVFTQEECTDTSFRVSAKPESATSGSHAYSVDTTGVIRIVPPGDPKPINPPEQEESQEENQEESNE